MKKSDLLLPLILLFLLGCSAAPATRAPRPAAQSTPVRGVTPATPSQVETAPSAATGTAIDPTPFFAATADLLKVYRPPETDPASLRDALAKGTMDYMRAAADPAQAIADQPAFDLLQTALGNLQTPDQVSADVAALHLSDSEGGSEDIILISFEKLMGFAVIAIHRLGGSYTGIAVDGPDALRGETGPAARNFLGGTVSADDVTGDGVDEAIYTYEIPGASGSTTELHVLRWAADEKAFKAIFQASLVNWAGESSYDLIPTDHGQDIQLSYPWFGIFDHKLAQHPMGTQLWSYDPKGDKFVWKSETVEPAQTVRQQLNVAEDLFRQGEFEKAVTEDERAWSDQSLKEEDLTGRNPATRGFARFRECELLALLGRETEARAACTDAVKSGGDLAKLAEAFVKSDTGSDGAIRAWAALPSAVDLDNSIYLQKSNLDLPASATDVFYPGEIVAAYLNAHPKAGAQAFTQIRAVGFNPVNSLTVDLDGDGTNEYVFVTPSGGKSPNQYQHLWLVYRGQARWLARDIRTDAALSLDPNVISLPGSAGRAIKLTLPATSQPSEQVLTWDRSRLIYLDPQTLKPIESRPEWPVVGGGRTGIRF